MAPRSLLSLQLEPPSLRGSRMSVTSSGKGLATLKRWLSTSRKEPLSPKPSLKQARLSLMQSKVPNL
jgi:hypothetical protein